MGKRKEKPTKYRLNVAAIVVDQSGRMLTCRRSDMDSVWQLPQGGVDAKESPEEALNRELFEEIGASNFRVIARLPESIRYEWPEHLYGRGFRGQEQIYFLIQLSEGEKIRFDATGDQPEFDAFEWVTPEEFLRRVSGFKAEAYRQALAYFQLTYPDLLKSD